MRQLLWVLFLSLTLIGPSWAQSAGVGALDEATQNRYHALIAELRCVVCQNRSIAESDAPLAADLRRVVLEKIEAGKSDREIKAYLVERYGDWILYDPPIQTSTILLWSGPFVLLLIGLLLIFTLMRRRGPTDTSTSDAPSLDEDRLDRILAEDRNDKHEPY